MRLRIIVAIVLIGIGARVPAQTPAALVPAPAYGMNLRVISHEQADKMVELGATTARVVFGWDVIEGACKGCFNWTTTDAWVAEARRTHLAVFATLAYTPRWANGGHVYSYPPVNYQDWYDFVYAVVARYRADVSLWGIWNEPNLDIYLRDNDVRTYQMLVVTAASAVRAADPAGRVLGPEVSHHAFRDGWYLAAMRSVGDLFDIVTVHWYPDGPDLGFMMDQLVRPFADGKPIWLTESGMKPCDSVLAETGQAALYNKVFKAFLSRRTWWTGLMFYDLYDPPEPMDCGSGILRPDYSNRPAFLLYQAFIRGNR